MITIRSLLANGEGISEKVLAVDFCLGSGLLNQGLLYLDGRNSQKYLHQDQADF